MEVDNSPVRMSFGQKIKCFFIKPAELFKYYKENPKWGLNLIVIGLLTGVFTYVLRVIAKEEFRNIFYIQLAKMPPDRAEAAKASVEFFLSPVMNIVYGVVGVISAIAIILLTSLVCFGLIRFLKGKVKFKQVLSVYLVCYWTINIGMILKLAYTYVTHKMTFFNLMPSYGEAFINNVDLFILWQSILLVFGFSTVAELDEKKSVAVVILIWLGSVAISMVSVMLNK